MSMRLEITCDNCPAGYEWDLFNHVSKKCPNKSSATRRLRAMGWAFGKRILCPSCKKTKGVDREKKKER